MTLRARGRMVGFLMQVALVPTICICVIEAARAADRVVALTENQNASTAEIAKAQNLEIRLPVQGGTGFSWALTHAPSAPVRLVSSEILPTEAGNRPGGPQMQLFVFTPKAAGSGDIELGYRRPWEKDAPPARAFSVHVVVRD
jgi:inhibitor of cysteine peptidase